MWNFISPEEPYLAATPVRVCYDATVTIPREIIEVNGPRRSCKENQKLHEHLTREGHAGFKSHS